MLQMNRRNGVKRGRKHFGPLKRNNYDNRLFLGNEKWYSFIFRKEKKSNLRERYGIFQNSSMFDESIIVVSALRSEYNGVCIEKDKIDIDLSSNKTKSIHNLNTCKELYNFISKLN